MQPDLGAGVQRENKRGEGENMPPFSHDAATQAHQFTYLDVIRCISANKENDSMEYGKRHNARRTPRTKTLHTPDVTKTIGRLTAGTSALSTPVVVVVVVAVALRAAGVAARAAAAAALGAAGRTTRVMTCLTAAWGRQAFLKAAYRGGSRIARRRSRCRADGSAATACSNPRHEGRTHRKINDVTRQLL